MVCQWGDEEALILQKDFSVAIQGLYTGNNLLLPDVETDQTSTANEVVIHSKLDPKWLNALLVWLEFNYNGSKALANNSLIFVLFWKYVLRIPAHSWC